jgi:NADH:ubiquinone oxidoreductase subunit F (NADH-binding)/(2Fe-2S) ferredoxin/NAD-dependent dihydropyrimidine dehydrogenase PreA subunit
MEMGRTMQMSKIKSATELEKWRADLQANSNKAKQTIKICRGTGCTAAGADEVEAFFQKELIKNTDNHQVELKVTGCHGMCEQGPIVVIDPDKVFYPKVKPKGVQEIIDKTVVNGQVIDSFLFEDPGTGEKIKFETDIPFYREQKRIVLKNCGLIDPTKIEDYVSVGGYGALSKVLFEMDREDVIDEIKNSGLRGRGGAGFPTGIKWEFCSRSRNFPKYIICNADEGDPGAFMDRSILEGDPHSVIEGMALAAYAIGSTHGYIYCRVEYPLAIKHLNIAIEQAHKYGFLGDNILGTDFTFNLEIKAGAGAFVCGEETALLASIEGRRGEPRPRPPFPTVSGLWKKPTNVNNVKSYAMTPQIILNGSEWFSSIGTPKSPGTATFALTGKINHTGLIEVPMGITLREIIYGIGGGIPDGKEFKAVQTGGPLGGCLPASALDTPVDFDSLTEAGATMGSGGMIVVDEDTCMVEFARYFLTFASAESCGKCVPCRIGGQRLLEALTRIIEGKGVPEDLDLIEYISRNMREGSLCALGQLTPGPILSALRFFIDEFEAHIYDKECPAKVCKELITFSIIEELCEGCMVCMRNCPSDAISGSKREPHVIDIERCTRCGICTTVCKFDAVFVE